jgi:hypothetical protein
MKIKIEKPIPYNVYWERRGAYGRSRVSNMIRRKEARHRKKKFEKKKVSM